MTYLIIVIDDVRIPAPSSPDGTIQVELHRTPTQALEALTAYHAAGARIDELWLDHDMGWDPTDRAFVTIWPVVNWLEEQARQGTPLDVANVFVHTSNPPEASRIVAALYPHYRVLRGELPLGGGAP